MRTLKVMRAGARVTRAYLRDRHDHRAWVDVLFDEAQQLGGVYVKFLQQLVSSEQLAREWELHPRHYQVFDQVARESIDIQAFVVSELGEDAHVITDIHPYPCATGSFAQVYRARLRTGESVIIKALRPSVRRYLKADMRLLSCLSYGAQFFVRSGIVDLPRLTRKFLHALALETEYRREAEKAEYLREYFGQRRADVIIPKTYRELTTSAVLVQDYVDGIPLNEVTQQAQAGRDSYAYVRERTGSDLAVQLSVLGAEFLVSLFQADYIMSDPHPGNIILLPDNQVALIDFGLVEQAPVHRSAFLGMVSQYRSLYEGTADVGTLAIAMIAFYDYELYEAMMTLSGQGSYSQQVRSYVSRVFEQRPETHRYMSERRITQLFSHYLNAGNRFGIKINERDIVLQKAMHSFLSSVRMAVGDRHQGDWYHEIIHASLVAAEAEAYRMGVRESRRKTPPMKLEQAQDIIIDWLSTVADRDRAAYQAIAGSVTS